MPSFQNPDGSFFNESTGGPVLVSHSLSGSTIKMRMEDRVLFVNAGLLASLTVWLPRGCAPGERVELCFETGITALTIKDGFGVTVSSAPTSADGPGATIHMKYISESYGWFYWK